MRFDFTSIFEQIAVTATGTREDYGVSECIEPDSASFREQVFPFINVFSGFCPIGKDFQYS